MLPLWAGDPLTESQERRHFISEVEDFFLAVAGSVLLLSSSGLAVFILHVGQSDDGTNQGNSTAQQQARKFFFC